MGGEDSGKVVKERVVSQMIQEKEDNLGRIRVWTDGSSLGNGTKRAKAGSGVYFGPGDCRNRSERLPGPIQTNQRAEIYVSNLYFIGWDDLYIIILSAG